MSSFPATQELLAIHGGTPVRSTLLPYGRQRIDEDDIQSVVSTLRSDWLTTGPKVGEFEEALAKYVGARYAVSFSSATAALHGAVTAAGISAGDEVVTTPLTFCATANCVLYCGGVPVFADVHQDTLNLDVSAVERKLTSATRAVIPVDYAGHAAEIENFLELAERHGLIVIEDACHALGAEYRGRRVGGIAHMTVFSFHPVKHVATGEGGMVTTNDATFAQKLREFRNHGITSDARQRSASGQWHYEMVSLGFNYRLTDIACALGGSQLKKLDANLERRREIAAHYEWAMKELPLKLPVLRHEITPAWHLYPIRLKLEALTCGRAEIFRALRGENIGVNVHYIPVHLHPYYQERFHFHSGEYPVAEGAYEQLISLPMFHGMTDGDVEDVISAVHKVLSAYMK
jgi:perosamine synthetase